MGVRYVCVFAFIQRLFHFAINSMTTCPDIQTQTATSESYYPIY